MVDPELLKHAHRVLYTCRLYDPAKHAKSGVEVRCCGDCGRGVAVTTSVLRDRMQAARDAGVTLEIVCDRCSEKAAEEVGHAIISLPTPEELAEAN